MLELKAEMKEGGPKEKLDWTMSDWDTPMLFFDQRGYVRLLTTGVVMDVPAGPGSVT